MQNWLVRCIFCISDSLDRLVFLCAIRFQHAVHKMQYKMTRFNHLIRCLRLIGKWNRFNKKKQQQHVRREQPVKWLCKQLLLRSSEMNCVSYWMSFKFDFNRNQRLYWSHQLWQRFLISFHSIVRKIESFHAVTARAMWKRNPFVPTEFIFFLLAINDLVSELNLHNSWRRCHSIEISKRRNRLQFIASSILLISNYCRFDLLSILYHCDAGESIEGKMFEAYKSASLQPIEGESSFSPVFLSYVPHI